MCESKTLLLFVFPASGFPLRYFAPSAVKRFQVYMRELPFLGFMFEMPIVVAGVGVGVSGGGKQTALAIPVGAF